MNGVWGTIIACLSVTMLVFGGVEEGLVAHYPFDGNVTDETGNGATGIIHGAFLVADRCGVPNSAFGFDGTDDFIEIPHTSALDVANGGVWTLSYWLKTSVSRPFQHAVDKYDETNSNGWGSDIRGGLVQARLNSGVWSCGSSCTNSYNRQTTTPRIDDGQWHLATVVFDSSPADESGSMSIYVDAVLRDTIRVAGHFNPGMNYNTPGRIVVGKAYNQDVSSEFLEGAIDDIRVYNRGLSPAEIADLFSVSCPASLTCLGFQPPLDADPVTVKQNRALPLKAELADVNGIPVTDLDLISRPVLRVTFSSDANGDAIDVTDEAFPSGQGTDGNQFVFNDGLWRFNLKTKNYSAPGSYTITMISGDDNEYIVGGCTARFVVEP